MTRIELYPTLDHCIESTARHEFNKLAAEYAKKGDAGEEKDREIVLLRCFLEEADFPALRGMSEPHLLKHKKVRFVLTDAGGLDYRMELL
jgi:hypothetical protein